MIPLSKKERLKRIKDRICALRSRTEERVEKEPCAKQPHGKRIGPKLAH